MGGLAFAGSVALAAFAGLVYLIQPRMVFFPTRGLQATPQSWGLDYEDVEFASADGVRLHGWFIPRTGARRVLLFLHGNAGNISHRRASVAIFHRLGLHVFLFDYRGYGRSGGRPDETGLYRDARAAWDHLVHARGLRPRQIVLFGRSLGGVVAAHLAAEVQPAGLILESTFSSARDMARVMLPVVSRLVPLRYRFDAVAAVRRVRVPVLVLHSREDSDVPYRLGRRVFEAANEPKRFVDLRGDHNSGFLASEPDYSTSLAAFLATLPADP